MRGSSAISKWPRRAGNWQGYMMGTFSVSIHLRNELTGEFFQLDALVDTGATYTMLPTGFLETLGVKVVGQRDFELADSRAARYDIGEARLRLNGDELTVLVVFAPEGTSPLLGATALELFGLAADPVNQRLIPVPALLETSRHDMKVHEG